MTDSFLKLLTTYGGSRSDCPKDWHLHAGLATLAAAMGSDVCTDGRSRPIYPNIWSVNIGPSGSGKSVALDLSKMLVEKAGLGSRILANSFSLEALHGELAKGPNRILYTQEFGGFMEMLDRSYMHDARRWLTELYDVPDEDRRVLRASRKPGEPGRNEEVVLRRPCLTILGASTPEWFAQSYKAADMKGGFLARFAYCPSEEYEEYVAEPGPHDQRALTVMADHLRTVAEMVGTMDFSGVLTELNDYDRRVRLELREGQVPPEFAGIRNRATLQVKKAAMLYHASSDPYTYRITAADLRRAIGYVDRSYLLTQAFVATHVAQGRDDEDLKKVLRIVAQKGGHLVPRSAVLMNARFTAERLNKIERTLVESEQLIVDHRGKATYSLPPLTNVQRSFANGTHTAATLRVVG
jgi:hypothetical protein